MTALVISLDARGHGMLALDDKELSNAVNGFTLTSQAGQASVLELDIVPYLTTVTAEVTVTIPAATREALIALGWTPPGECTCDTPCPLAGVHPADTKEPSSE
jgi:ABC-type phosphate transport system permease subunit